MDWLELKIDTSHAGLDAVTDMLEQQGVTGVMIDDEADFQSFLENNRQYWDYVDDDLLAQKKGVSRVTFYLERNEDAYGTVAAVRMAMSALKKEHPEYAPLLLTMADVADEDWENNWKQFYKPMEIGSRLLVVPEWEEAADPTRVKLVLNPGLTFGTGSHATTRLCLQALDTHIHGGERVLDLGCGSGILSIAALRLGAESAFACDIDEKCVDVAYENAALNGIGKDRYTVRWGNVLTDAALRQEMGVGYDIVVDRGGCHHGPQPPRPSLPEARRPLPLLRYHRRAGGGGAGKAEGRRLGCVRAAQQRGLVQLSLQITLRKRPARSCRLGHYSTPAASLWVTTKKDRRGPVFFVLRPSTPPGTGEFTECTFLFPEKLLY